MQAVFLSSVFTGIFLKKFNVYLFLRERDRARVGAGGREEGDTESKAGSGL